MKFQENPPSGVALSYAEGRTERRDEANMAMFTVALPKASQNQQKRRSSLHSVRCGWATAGLYLNFATGVQAKSQITYYRLGTDTVKCL